MLSDLILRVRALFERTAVDREIDEELRFHVDRQVESYERAGLDHDEAVRRARLEFGGLDQVKEEYRDALGVRVADEVWWDMRLGVRSLRSTPVASAVAVLSLALGIGANTAVFSIVNSLLLRALPVKQPERLALVTGDTSVSPARADWSFPIWEQLSARPELFDAAFAWRTEPFNLARGGETEFVNGIWASGGMFETLGVPALLGRTLTDADDRRGGGRDGPVAVISYALWQRRFAGAADTIGRTLTIERIPFTIVGITPPDFFGPDVGRSFDVAIPIGVEPLVRGAKESWLDGRDTWWLQVMVRLKPGQTLDGATQALRAVQRRIREATLPTNWPPDDRADYLKQEFTLLPAASGSSELRYKYERPLLLMLGVVAMVLLIACANIANLLLARAAARRHEWSVRLALGASRWRLTRLLLTESLMLSALGAAGGAAVAWWAGRLFLRLISTQGNPVFLDLRPDWRMLVFTMAVAVVTAALFGTAPAYRAAAVAPIDALNDHGRGSSSDARGPVADGLVVAQVALSVVLVVASGLFLRTFDSLAHMPLGFDRDRVLLATIDAQRTGIAPDARLEIYDRIRRRLLAVPGVASAGVSVVTPVSGHIWGHTVDLSGSDGIPDPRQGALFNAITPGWLTTWGTRIVAGRDITAHDTRTTARVALVNEAFARTLLHGASPIGRTFQAGRVNRAPPREIVGVVADAVYRELRDPVPATVYVPLDQYDTDHASGVPSSVNVSVRAMSGSPALLTRGVSAAIAEIGPDLAVTFQPLADLVDAALIQERLTAMLSGFFGALALLLAGLGLYGVTAYAVSRRRTEIGIRMALGATPAGVFRLVLSRTLVLVSVGVVIGCALSAWASRFAAALLYGIEPRDPGTLIGAVVVLAAVSTMAAWLPARRAARIDPAAVLRES